MLMASSNASKNSHPSFTAFLSYAFRPFYTLAVLYAIVAILLWYPLDYKGSKELSGFLWHAHEMIWGYTGAIIVGFLLTAVSNWTNQPPLKNIPLLILVIFWLCARVFIYIPNGFLVSTVFDALFYLSASIALMIPLIKSNNYHNIIISIALLLFGLTNSLFYLTLKSSVNLPVLEILQMGLLMVAGFIGIIGTRVIPFFTSMTLQLEKKNSPMLIMSSALLIPMLMTILIILKVNFTIVMLMGLLTMSINIIQIIRWWNRKILLHPLLWVLHIGYLFTALGVGLLGVSYAYAPKYLSGATHLITIGGIGMLTLGMMSRTALGHTGRAMILPRPLCYAFYLMIIALIFRLIAALMGNNNAYLLSLSAHSFASALAIYAYVYIPWLVTKSPK